MPGTMSVKSPNTSGLANTLGDGAPPPVTSAAPMPDRCKPGGAGVLSPTSRWVVPAALGRPAPADPVTKKVTTTFVVSPAGLLRQGGVTFTEKLGNNTFNDLTVRLRVRDPANPAKPSNVTSRIEVQQRQTLIKSTSLELGVAAGAYVESTQARGGGSSGEAGAFVKGTAKYTPNGRDSAQLSVTAVQALTFPGAATKLNIDGRITRTLTPSNTQVYLGAVAEPNLTDGSMPASAYAGLTLPMSPQSALDLRVNYGLRGNGSSNPDAVFLPRERGVSVALGATFQF